jgi:hypothetical protein
MDTSLWSLTISAKDPSMPVRQDLEAANRFAQYAEKIARQKDHCVFAFL